MLQNDYFGLFFGVLGLAGYLYIRRRDNKKLWSYFLQVLDEINFQNYEWFKFKRSLFVSNLDNDQIAFIPLMGDVKIKNFKMDEKYINTRNQMVLGIDGENLQFCVIEAGVDLKVYDAKDILELEVKEIISFGETENVIEVNLEIYVNDVEKACYRVNFVDSFFNTKKGSLEHSEIKKFAEEWKGKLNALRTLAKEYMEGLNDHLNSEKKAEYNFYGAMTQVNVADHGVIYAIKDNGESENVRVMVQQVVDLIKTNQNLTPGTKEEAVDFIEAAIEQTEIEKPKTSIIKSAIEKLQQVNHIVGESNELTNKAQKLIGFFSSILN